MILRPCQRMKRVVEHEGDTNSSWRTWNNT